MKARGAEVTVTKKAIEVHRSDLARNLWPDASIDPADLIGWYKQQPDSLSPGHLELITDHERVRINFSAGEQEEYSRIDAMLTLLQAGYEFESEDDQSQISPSVAEWVEDVAQAENTADNSGSSSEKSETKKPSPWANVATPDVVPEPNKNADIDNPLYGQVVCVTGDVEPYSKGDVWNMIAQAGATVSKSVTKKTTMLVVGEWASMTSKEKRARELQSKGQEIDIVDFKEFLDLV